MMESDGEGGRDIFRVFQILDPHSALEAGFKKLKQAAEKCSKRTDVDEARGRKRDRKCVGKGKEE